ncbi:MAG: alanine racemase [Campylobacterota bacterium]|nr:alanine racemase [Campylobacterota bacterium]
MGYIELNKKAFFNNADYYTKLLGDTKKLCIALKDNAYGHGIEPMAQLSNIYGIKHCIVRDIDEANIVSNYDFESILVLYEIPKKKYNNNYIFGINSIEKISSYPENTKVELKIDTGMSRNGIKPSELNEAIKLILSNNLILNGVFTHFCCADTDNDDNLTKQQEKLFLEVVAKIKSKVKTQFRVHCANTAGVELVNNNLYDIARVGIGLYGYNKPIQQYLKPILSLWANKISTRILDKNDSIGYGATFIIEKDNTTISNYDIGYGDGFFRLNERKKGFLENGSSILGRVSMDNFTTYGDDDKVCLFKNATALASTHDTIEYEILTHLSSKIKRTII